MIKTPPVSHTLLSKFQTCPRQYEAHYITKEFPSQPTEATIYGNRMHKAMELRIRDKTQLPEEFVQHESLAVAVENLRGEVFVEKQLSVTEELKATGWSAPDAWLRGIADVIVEDRERERIHILDWKTGKVKRDLQQMNILATCSHYPNYDWAKTVNVALAFVAHDAVIKQTYTVKDMPEVYESVQTEVQKLHQAHEVGVFPPKQSGLCRGWCPVTTCEFWSPKRDTRR